MIVPNPVYTTEDECNIALMPIPVAIYRRFLQEWMIRNPPPTPPKRPVTYVDTTYLEDDTNNEWFIVQFNLWQLNKERAELDFILSRGTGVNPPEDWTPDPDVTSAKPSPQEIKALWVMEMLTTEKDVEGIKEAIVSLTMPTQAAVDDAEKK